jgi:hypothetical protein
MLNVKAGRPYPDDPLQRTALHVFNTMSLSERAAFHRATCLNSRHRHDLFTMQKTTERIVTELKEAYPMASPKIKDLTEARRYLPPTCTVYNHPPDFPSHVVTRVWYRPHFPLPCACVVDTAEQARAMLEDEGLYCLGREQGDDLAILESWI